MNKNHTCSIIYYKIHFFENVKTYLDNASNNLTILPFGLVPHNPRFKHGFTI